jgi:hypothetical protein
MKTATLLSLLGLWALQAMAQPVRTDILWARDVAGAALTLDGQLDEPVWQQAERIDLVWNNPTFYEPGGGWDNFFDSFTIEPTDPVKGTLYLLRDGNKLWIGLVAQDKSIGGDPSNDFFRNDGLIVAILNKNRRQTAYNGPHYTKDVNVDEFFFTWRESSAPGALPKLNLGGRGGDLTSDRTVWDGTATVDGTSNDDATEDVGYTLELWIDLSKLGFDMTQPEGDHVPISFALYDYDYAWPADPARQYLSRAWWQNPWGNDMPHGVGYVFGRPDVTVSSGAVPAVNAPDLRIPVMPVGTTLAVDGQLDELVWTLLEPTLSLQYQMPLEALDALPGLFGPYQTHWFRPGGDAPEAPPVVDPTVGRIYLVASGTTLYVGLDTDDQAINGDLTDGLRINIRAKQNSRPGAPYVVKRFRVGIDSSGAAVLMDDARPDTAGNTPVQAAVHLKGSSTIADPYDVDEGYQLEIAIDLTQIPGYEEGLGDGTLGLGFTFFDGDALDPADQSYTTFVWYMNEGNADIWGGPTALAYVDPLWVVANESWSVELPRTLYLIGSAPNPFRSQTRIAYFVPEAGQVELHVFDLLGRQVKAIAAGYQQAGRHELMLDATGMAAGLYLYRIRWQAGGRSLQATGRLLVGH